jgi:hypothetical protein
MVSLQPLKPPKNRGRFSKERPVSDQIHADRFQVWVEGLSIAQIAAASQVSERTIHSSVARRIARLHQRDRHRIIRQRRENRTAWKRTSAALEEYWQSANPDPRIWKNAPVDCKTTEERNFERLLDHVKALHEDL